MHLQHTHDHLMGTKLVGDASPTTARERERETLTRMSHQLKVLDLVLQKAKLSHQIGHFRMLALQAISFGPKISRSSETEIWVPYEQRGSQNQT